ncbi:MAG: hypothetical protein ABFS42_15745 [Candidatus Krumholzibacteriota bacterium]
MKTFTSRLPAAATILLILLSQSTANAFSGAGASSLTFNTSSRAEGMGGAGVGLAWDTNTNHWANPALLAFRPGIQYIHFSSNPAEGLYDDFLLTSKELTLGAYGVTLLLGTGPVDGVRLDLGEMDRTDETGISTGVFEGYMKSEHWGIGVDFVQLAEIIQGKEPGAWTRKLSLSAGYVWKDFEDNLTYDPGQPASGEGYGTGQARDWGLLLKWTPINTGLEKDLQDGGTVAYEAGFALGYSKLNSTGDFIHHYQADQSDPFPTMHVYGGSLRFAVPLIDSKREQWNANGLGILGDVVNPLFSFTAAFQMTQPGYVWDAALQDYKYEWDKSGSFDETGYGFEVGLANILYYRRGHKRADYYHVDDATDGFGVNLQAGRLGGARYDWASTPNAGGLPDVTSRTWSFWVDPVAVFEVW